MTPEELEIAKAACCVGTIWNEYEGKENFDHMVGLRVKHLIELVRNYQQPSLPSNLDEAAWKYGLDNQNGFCSQSVKVDCFKAGAEWMAGQGWIDDGSMPPETKYEEDTMQGHREWTESEPVLAWDSMYGPRVDWTRNGKWISEQTGGYTGQICHGIIAWRPIPKYNEKQ